MKTLMIIILSIALLPTSAMAEMSREEHCAKVKEISELVLESRYGGAAKEEMMEEMMAIANKASVRAIVNFAYAYELNPGTGFLKGTGVMIALDIIHYGDEMYGICIEEMKSQGK